VLAVDELREDVHRDLMRYFMQSGQRALALRQFEECRAALRREFAIHPMDETVALYRQIAEGAVLSPRRLVATLPKRRTLPISRPEAAASPSSRQVPFCPADTTGEAPVSIGTTPVVHVQTARALIAEADEHLNQTLKLIQH